MLPTMLSDEQWELLAPVFRGNARQGGRPPVNANRLTVAGSLWIARAGSPWRDLPAGFGKWNSVYRRCRRWTKAGRFEQLFNGQAGELQLDTAMVDGTLVKAHQHGTDAPKRGCSGSQSQVAQVIGRSRGGLNAKIVAVVAARGRWVKFVLKPGPAAEAPELPALISGLAARELSADQAYDPDLARSRLAAAGIAPARPYRARRRQPAWHDPGVYRLRPRVENRFAALKEYRGIATRYYKLAELYAATLSLVAAALASKGRESGRNPGGWPAVNRQLAI